MQSIMPQSESRKPAWAAAAPAEPVDATHVGCSSSTLKLAEADLARSCLSLADAEAVGMFAVDRASSIDPGFKPVPSLVLQYFDATGSPLTYERDGTRRPFCRVRYLLDPSGWRLKAQRYAQPANTGTPIYLPRTADWSDDALRGSGGIVLTEGEKKAAALCSQGIAAVAVGGVFNFASKEAAVPLHPDVARIARLAGDLYVVFDSDAAEKPDVLEAERRLVGQIAVAGGRPHVVRLPPADDGSKVGTDDYLVSHGAEALLELINAAPVVGADTLATSGEIISLPDLLSREVHPVPELIPGWLERGTVTFIAGQGGSNKSRMCLQIGLCLDAGVLPPGLGGADRAQIERGPIATLVYVSAEDDGDELARRAQAITKQLKLRRRKDSRAVFLPLAGKDAALVVMREDGQHIVTPRYAELVALLHSIPGHKILVLDSAYDFARWTGKTKIDEDAVNWFVKTFLTGICGQCDATLLIPWHPSQAGSERADMSGWSVAWHNAPRARWALKESSAVADAFELSVTKRNHGRKAEPVLFSFHEGALLLVADVPDDGKESALRSAVAAVAVRVAREGIPFNRKDRIPSDVLAEVTRLTGRQVSQHAFRDALGAAVRAGELQIVIKSRHRAPGFYPPGEEAAELANAARHRVRGGGDG
jgi:hypothetical protein